MRYRHRVTFQAPIESRTPAGDVEYVYENVSDLVDLPATIVAATLEQRGPRQTVIEDEYQIVLAGDRAVTPAMAVLDGEAVYDVKSIAPMLDRRVTVITARRVSL